MPQLFKLYKKTGFNQDETPVTGLSADLPYTYKVFRPSIMKTGLDNSENLKRFLWYLITLGKLRIFYIMERDIVIHYSFIIPKNFRFPFMNKGDLQIGPCFTDPKFRGRGIYTHALKLIPTLFSKQTSNFWIYTTDVNKISQHVIEKAGYGFNGYFISSGLLRILKKQKVQQSEK
jgi:RimJ/RimL family protein N-acetyltransferase